MTPPPFLWMKNKDGKDNSKVHEWIQSITEVPVHSLNQADAVIIGIPLSRSSISASAASEFPDAFRKSWKGFTTYNIEEDVDLTSLSVIDLGDTEQHVTDIKRCHHAIVEAVKDIKYHYPNPLPISIGGDHSITAQVIRGLKETFPQQSIGIIQFDTHFDLRDPGVLGPANGTPIRLLINNGLIEGDNVYNIGLHGFFNTKDLKEYADLHHINYFTMQDVNKMGISTVVNKALDELSRKVDMIYVTCDMDVLDMAYAPGVPAATPGGMSTRELFEAITITGKHHSVGAVDIVCLDPQKDLAHMTVKAGTHVFLNFLTGLALRKNRRA
ncbi:agmatinase family protein [Bacillus tamaricis]|uniref:Agmatinase family protein n=2 Tax=Evansella tamaricis TaxID=2069301 RepID=A0ABS6JG66_9BACI|nr:agmatinase family protein [Evansella tamaricis]